MNLQSKLGLRVKRVEQQAKLSKSYRPRQSGLFIEFASCSFLNRVVCVLDLAPKAAKFACSKSTRFPPEENTPIRTGRDDYKDAGEKILFP
jgi:hypothetical protein